MKNFIGVSKTLFLVFSIAFISCILFGYNPKYGSWKLWNEEKISMAENADPEYQAELKGVLATKIESRAGLKPEKLAFVVGGGNYQTQMYTVTVYYKLPNNDNWYAREYWWTSFFGTKYDEMFANILYG